MTYTDAMKNMHHPDETNLTECLIFYYVKINHLQSHIWVGSKDNDDVSIYILTGIITDELMRIDGQAPLHHWDDKMIIAFYTALHMHLCSHHI